MDRHPQMPGGPPPRALLALRETAEARRVASMLEKEGIEAVLVPDDVAGYNLLETEQVDILICETRAARIEGLRLLRVARMRNPDVCAILIAGAPQVDLATRALEEGAHDFQTRPLNLEKIQAVVRRGLETQRLVGEVHELARRLDRKFGFRNLIGSSSAMARVFNRVLQVCGMESPVLILGESGTGRELVATAIHQNSPRRTGPLVRLDCEGLESGVLERELFGGPGSGAGRSRAGRIELAESGTLILDSVDSLPEPAQRRLVRLLRDGEYERTGGGRTRRPDVRLLAVAPPDLRQRVGEGRFRRDLFDHLRAVTIEMPALRHRKRDIPLLVDHFLQEAARESGREVDGVQPVVIDRLVRYPWPGNVRELKGVVRAMVQSASPEGPIDVADLPAEIREGTGRNDNEIRIPIGLRLAEIERRVIEATLRRTGGDRAETARILGVGLRTLQRRLAEYGMVRRRPPAGD
ncbi:MAG: response regulator [Candidatus Eisenbacteria bacterium]|nr:response regulator [Candidatus Latescibacterota bacterium]MBD3301219.1 response regulator [Candidatus Eisenbacteria bacterium]